MSAHGVWLVEACALPGGVPAAVRQMDAMLVSDDNARLGNMPQALGPLALVYAATAIQRGAT